MIGVLLNNANIRLVRDHYAAISGDLERLVEDFYRRLFERRPDIRALFPADLARQREHLATAISVIARNIDHLAMLEGPLMEMGARHVAYGARPEHYSLLRELLLESMAGVRPEHWNPEVRSAWHDAINAVSVAMLRGGVHAATLADAPPAAAVRRA